MRRFLMAVAAIFALLLTAQLTTKPAEAAALSRDAAGVLERTATAPAEYAQWRRYRRGYYRPRFYGPRFYRPRYYRPRYYRRRFYRPRFYGGPRFYRPYGYRRFYY